MLANSTRVSRLSKQQGANDKEPKRMEQRNKSWRQTPKLAELQVLRRYEAQSKMKVAKLRNEGRLQQQARSEGISYGKHGGDLKKTKATMLKLLRAQKKKLRNQMPYFWGAFSGTAHDHEWICNILRGSSA